MADSLRHVTLQVTALDAIEKMGCYLSSKKCKPWENFCTQGSYLARQINRWGREVGYVLGQEIYGFDWLIAWVLRLLLAAENTKVWQGKSGIMNQ